MLLRRLYSTAAASREGWLYVDSVFPIQLGRWDFRHYFGFLRQEHLLTSLQRRLEQLSAFDFKPLEYQPQPKDGGVFVRFSYTPPADLELPSHWTALQHALREQVAKQGALPTWLGMGSGHLWVVRGSPWKEDLNRYASAILKVAFDGPDIQEQSLYEICRPYGRIRDLSSPVPVPAGTLRSSYVTFQHVHSATVARNVIHGIDVASGPDSAPAKTRIRTQYEAPIESHVVSNWMSSHPKVVLPILIFLLGTLTYTIFDPVRSLMVEAKMLDWFDYRKFKFYEWLKSNTLDRLSIISSPHPASKPENGWKERGEAVSALQRYLNDMPSTIAFVHGPKGSGKASMVDSIIQQSERNTLFIDCKTLNNAPSDSALVAALAAQTGYWPVFNFVNSMGSLIDLASVGLIGQKAGLSNSLPEQLKQVLDVVTIALRRVALAHRSEIQKEIQNLKHIESKRKQKEQRRRSILAGTWHDCRLDSIAGNGIMSELGVGDEIFSQDKELPPQIVDQEKSTIKSQALDDIGVDSLPVVVIRHFAAGWSTREDVLTVLSQWAAYLVENKVAHVIVLSDNRENSKKLAKALPTKPLNTIALSDADSSSSLSFVNQKLQDAGVDIGISPQETQYVERLGGRASDLESLIHKVRSGMKVDEAVEDIINRGVAELRKSAFGDDADDAKNLPWTRYQAWKVLKALSKSPEVRYHETLIDFPFKGDEVALRNMEHAELISILTHDGRPSKIRPGRPVLKWVFDRVVNDKVFQASQELAYNEKQILDTEGKIREYEEELAVLVDTMEKEKRPWWSLRCSPCVERARYVGDKLSIAGRKVEMLERKNGELKKLLSHMT
ncbi:RNA12 protein-domain-containing protein [Gymnopilus junonius]|uniref:Mitochondrial escape protein 2 n=1 Tax=Gymnopilus junonius TaxID=109634 RepID=A0A9P5NW09_GYMJU|nr:RNA12 protein-domain-containing protein [Gymnopilus junonius]